MMPGLLRRTGLAVIFSAIVGSAHGAETSLTVELELRQSIANQDNTQKTESSAAISFEPEIQGELGDADTRYRFTPFYRWDSEDGQRQHGDIRELYLLRVIDSWELLGGISKVFWGVVESSHLVDIINQTDTLEGLDGEDKLGQPMLRLSRAFEQSTLTLFMLPGFREREFLSPDNPQALPFAISSEQVYESDDEDEHIDSAVRYSGYAGMVDYGLSWFHGTSREPGFIPGENGVLTPFYPQIDQLGLDLQITNEAWLWKLEVIRRSFDDSSMMSDYSAAAGGLEYSVYGMNDGQFDLGLLAELHHDSRDDRANVLLQDDLFLGMRFGFTDAESTELLAGAIVDLEDDSTSFRVEGNRRVFGNARISLEAQLFTNTDPGNLAHGFRDSDFLSLSLEWFF